MQPTQSARSRLRRWHLSARYPRWYPAKARPVCPVKRTRFPVKFPRSAARTSEKELLKNFDVRPSRTEPTVIDGEITGKRAVRAYQASLLHHRLQQPWHCARTQGKPIRKLWIANFWHSTRTQWMPLPFRDRSDLVTGRAVFTHLGYTAVTRKAKVSRVRKKGYKPKHVTL